MPMGNIDAIVKYSFLLRIKIRSQYLTRTPFGRTALRHDNLMRTSYS